MSKKKEDLWKKKVGERLRKLRGRIPQRVIAELLGITQEGYNLIENGKNSLTIKNLLILSDYYGVSTASIIVGEDLEDGSE